MAADEGEKMVSVTREIPATPEVIFELLADPAKHRTFDGSDTVVEGHPDNPDRLSLGDRFGMKMRLGVPYRISNEVVAFEEGRVIAWRHLGHHVWRYELEPTDRGTTIVTESFNWGVARFPPMYEWVGYPARHTKNMARTLERLEAVVTGEG
ncbi:MAG: SRPBCC family protein [Actinomycetota bacterium]